MIYAGRKKGLLSNDVCPHFQVSTFLYGSDTCNPTIHPGHIAYKMVAHKKLRRISLSLRYASINAPNCGADDTASNKTTTVSAADNKYHSGIHERAACFCRELYSSELFGQWFCAYAVCGDLLTPKLCTALEYVVPFALYQSVARISSENPN